MPVGIPGDGEHDEHRAAPRGTAQLLPRWLRLYGALGTGIFKLRVVRA